MMPHIARKLEEYQALLSVFPFDGCRTTSQANWPASSGITTSRPAVYRSISNK